jgi:alkylation response protein AidB-like acyl-CoA dehydrogenase
MPSVILTPGIAGTILVRHGTQEQKDRWLPGFAAGTTRMSFAMTEPGAGSNSHRISTSAERHGDKYVLNGQKYYITDVDQADAIVVVARTGRSISGRGLLSLFIIDPEAPGLTRQEIDTAIAPDTQSTLFFDDVEVDAANIIGSENEGLRVAFDGMNPERILFAAVANGLARFALDKACSYARDRAVWDVPIGAHQAIAHPLAEGKIMLEQAKLMTRVACALYDSGLDAGEASNTAKFASADAAVHCLDRAIQTHGGNGMAAEYQLTDYWFLVRMMHIGPVSREMVLNYVAEHSLGLPRSY